MRRARPRHRRGHGTTRCGRRPPTLDLDRRGDHHPRTDEPRPRRPEIHIRAPAVLVELLADHPSFDAPGGARLFPACEGDAGLDLVACESVVLAPGQRAAVSAGIRIALPDGMEAQVRPRSGRSLREGLTVINAPGTIDPGYRGPVKVLLLNAAPALEAADLDGEPETLAGRLRAALSRRSVRIERGERVAQLVFARFERPTLELVDEVPTGTERGEGGFGSTGTA